MYRLGGGIEGQGLGRGSGFRFALCVGNLLEMGVLKVVNRLF